MMWDTTAFKIPPCSVLKKVKENYPCLKGIIENRKKSPVLYFNFKFLIPRPKYQF